MGRKRRRRAAGRSETPARGFSPRRGGEYFVLGLVAAPILVGIEAVADGPVSIGGAVLFVLGFAALAGLIGMFTDKVPL